MSGLGWQTLNPGQGRNAAMQQTEASVGSATRASVDEGERVRGLQLLAALGQGTPSGERALMELMLPDMARFIQKVAVEVGDVAGDAALARGATAEQAEAIRRAWGCRTARLAAEQMTA